MEMFDKVVKEINKLEEIIGVPKGFYYDITKRSDDWSFIISLHSLFEAACSQLIVKAIGRKELENIISKVDMADKVIYLKQLKLLEKGSRRFLRKLSEIRNFYVHNIKSISLNLKQYLQILDPNQLNSYVEAIRYGIREDFKVIFKEKELDRDAFCKDLPNLAIFISGYSVLYEIAKILGLEIREKELEKQKIKLIDKIVKSLMESTSSEK